MSCFGCHQFGGFDIIPSEVLKLPTLLTHLLRELVVELIEEGQTEFLSELVFLVIGYIVQMGGKLVKMQSHSYKGELLTTQYSR